MKIKCNDGIVRRFRCAYYDAEYVRPNDRDTVRLEAGNRASCSHASICLECNCDFGVHDTKILKPYWRAHICGEIPEGKITYIIGAGKCTVSNKPPLRRAMRKE